MATSESHRDESDNELLHFIGVFNGDCPTAQDFCDDIDFDLLSPPTSPIFGIETVNAFNDDSESIQRSSNCGVATKCGKEEVVASLLSEGSLEDSCFAALLSSTSENQIGEGQGDNFIAGAGKTATKKRKRDINLDASDEDLDATAARLEKDLKKLEQENKKLVDCFLTLGQQMQHMMAENDHLRGVLSTFNSSASDSEKATPSKKNDKSKEKPAKSTTISPTVQLLAQVAMLNGAMKKK